MIHYVCTIEEVIRVHEALRSDGHMVEYSIALQAFTIHGYTILGYINH